MKSLLRGSIFLAVVLLISKLIGFVYRMLFTRIAGETAVGIYMTVYPTFIFFIAVVQLGLPIAITRLVAQYHAVGKRDAVNAVLKKGLKISLISVVCWFPILVIVSPYIATTLLHNEDALYTILVAVAAIPIVVLAGVYRAYLQGIDKLSTTAWGTLLEQAVRLTLIAVLLPLTIGLSHALVAAATMGITALAEISSLLFSYFFYMRYRTTTTQSYNLSVGALFHTALPSAGSKLFGSFTWFLEPIIFLYALTRSGLTATSATTAYGIVSNVHIPLLLFPAFIPQALAIALIPSLSSLQATRNFTQINQQLQETVRVCSVIGCYAVAIFFICGDFLATRLFHIEQLNWIKLLAPIFFFYYIQSPLHSVLQALNLAHIAMKNSIIGGCLKLVCLFALASHPSLQISGAIIAIGIGVVVTSFMHVASVQSIPNVHLKWSTFLVPFIVFLLCITISSAFPTLQLQLSVVIGTLTVCLIVTRQIRFSDFLLIKQLFQRFTLNK